MVKTGPYVFCGGTTTIQADGTVLYDQDSMDQESYIVKKLIKLMAQADVSAGDVIEVKAYRTPGYKTYMTPKTDSYYEKVLKPVTPLYTAVTIPKLAKEGQLVEMEIMAVAGCAK